jgi:hypothetical protein
VRTVMPRSARACLVECAGESVLLGGPADRIPQSMRVINELWRRALAIWFSRVRRVAPAMPPVWAASQVVPDGEGASPSHPHRHRAIRQRNRAVPTAGVAGWRSLRASSKPASAARTMKSTSLNSSASPPANEPSSTRPIRGATAATFASRGTWGPLTGPCSGQRQ